MLASFLCAMCRVEYKGTILKFDIYSVDVDCVACQKTSGTMRLLLLGNLPTTLQIRFCPISIWSGLFLSCLFRHVINYFTNVLVFFEFLHLKRYLPRSIHPFNPVFLISLFDSLLHLILVILKNLWRLVVLCHQQCPCSTTIKQNLLCVAFQNFYFRTI